MSAQGKPQRPFDKIREGLNCAITAVRLTNEVLKLLPEGMRTRELQDHLIALLAPHVTAENLRRLSGPDCASSERER